MKNNPLGDYSWARSVLNQKGSVIDEVKFANEAFHAKLNHDLKINKSIAEKISGSVSPENAAARHANLLVSPNGFLESEDAFIKKYMKVNQDKNISVTEDRAKETYKALTEQFYDEYNRTEGISLSQGVATAGGGVTASTPIQYPGLDLLDKGSNKVVTDIIKTTNEALANPATTVVAIGDPTKDTYKKGDNKGLHEFLLWYLNQADLTDKSKDRTFSAVVSNIAAEDSKKGAITFKGIDPDVIKKYESTGKKVNINKVFTGEDLRNGFTVFFDKTQQISPFEKPMSNIETLLRLDGHAKSTGYEDHAGTVDWKFDNANNRVQAIWNPAYYDPKTLQWISTGQPQLLVDQDIANINESEKFVNNKLAIWTQQQMANGEKIAKHTANKK
jgi:hypothetical protein